MTPDTKPVHPHLASFAFLADEPDLYGHGTHKAPDTKPWRHSTLHDVAASIGYEPWAAYCRMTDELANLRARVAELTDSNIRRTVIEYVGDGRMVTKCEPSKN